MDAKNKQYNLTEVRFRVLKGSLAHDAVSFFEKNYNCSTRSKTVILALIDFKILFNFFSVRTFEGLLKKIGIKTRDGLGSSCPLDFKDCESYNPQFPKESRCVKDSNIGYCLKEPSESPK